MSSAIKIEWTPGASVDSIRIYRSFDPFTKDDLPSVYDTIPGNSDYYADQTVVTGMTYYYMVSKVKGTDEVFSPLISQCYLPETGHGNNVIVKGDWRVGYFGEVPDSEFLTPLEFANKLQDVIGRRLLGNAYLDVNLKPIARWQKFVYNGKVLFIPLYGIANRTFRVSWKALYEAGLVYGIPGYGQVPTNCTATPQEVILELDGFFYKVRLLRMTNRVQGQRASGITTINNITQHTNESTGSEVAQTYNRLFFREKRPWADIQFANFPTLPNNERQFHLMELWHSGNTSITSHTPINALENYTTTATQTVLSTNSTWIPVLELINQ